MKATDPDCFKTQVAALSMDKGLLGGIGRNMAEARADYCAISGDGDDEVPMMVVVVCVGKRAAAFKKMIDAWDDDGKPARRKRRAKR